jgi:hypothetical protein
MADRATTIALVGCARAKRPAPAPAGDLYVSDLFRKSRAYAKQCADRWFILSAEHGLLHPEQVVPPYDRELKNLSAVERAAWAARVLQALEAVLVGADRVVILAGKHYYERLVPALRERGLEVVLPLEGMGIGSRLAWLARHTRELPDARAAKVGLYERFIRLVAELGRAQGFPRLEDAVARGGLPARGVYFFIDSSEPAAPDSLPGRIVRVGAHGLITGSRSTLIGRLRQHHGSPTGGGNHRGSVFRQHVGFAMIGSGTAGASSWGSKRPDRLREASLEIEVSRYLRALLVVVLDVPDEPGPNSLRGLVERNAVGLLAGASPGEESSSPAWLGRQAKEEAIRASGLWNVRHVDHPVEAAFLRELESLAMRQLGGVRPSPRPTAGGTAAVEHERPVAAASDRAVTGKPVIELSAARFREVLSLMLRQAAARGQPWIDVTSGELHSRVGGYPGPSHRMPTCCSVMRAAMRVGDRVLAAPPKGVGASLVVRYRLDGDRAGRWKGEVDVDDQDAAYAADFEQQMRTIPRRAEAACPGYRPTMFAREVERHGGLATARKFLSTGPSVQSGLQRLAACGALHVSMECLVLRYWQLFSEEERSIALQRLHTVAAELPHLYPDLGAICRQR